MNQHAELHEPWITHRDMVCLVVALGFHSLLLLWKGGLLQLPGSQGQNLGDMVTEVTYLSDYQGGPDIAAEPGPAGASFFSKVRTFFKKSAPSKPSSDTPAAGLAMGPTAAIQKPTQPWLKTDSKLSDKTFQEKKEFSSMTAEEMAISKGQTANVVVAVPAQQGNFQTSGPALKEKSFKVGAKDVPFQIAQPKNMDTLANTNAVPVNVGRETSASVRVSGSDSVGPSFKDKSMSSGAFASAKPIQSGSGGGGFGSLATGGAGGSALATGAAGGSPSDPAGPGGGAIGSGGGGSGSRGTSGSGGSGSGTAAKSWGGGSGFGRAPMETLGRNSVPKESMDVSGQKGASSSDKDFMISGALRGRPIAKKVKPAYEKEWEGRVALKFSVDWNGRVLDGILVEISSGSPSFDQKVISALKQWMFSPLGSDRANEIQEGVITFIFRGV